MPIATPRRKKAPIVEPSKPAAPAPVISKAGSAGMVLEQTTLTTSTLRFRGLPCVGPKAEEAFSSNVAYILALTWDGKPAKILKVTSLEGLHDSWFMPNDKGSAAFLTFNDKGEPGFTCAKYDGYDHAENPLERGPHYYFSDESFIY
jgi:hypothetical protein